ncbi:extensin-like domain-containing protein [Tabrizicola flagellatus]|uniref:extensin-like domain-containing protein n=1 Tax=Tabrizicola flagellatus TaxID=2593021 RepID=UPI0011F1215A|nr:extensin family protein [Tabrizicola flagellatus]
MRRIWLALSLCLAQAAEAEAIDSTPRPPANPRLVATLVAPAPAPAPATAAAAPEVAQPQAEPPAAPVTLIRPLPRPAGLTAAAGATAKVEPVGAAAAPEAMAEARSLRPQPRPRALESRLAGLKAAAKAPGLDLSGRRPEPEIDLGAIPPPTRKEERKKRREKASMAGSVCGVAAIKGEEIARISSKVKGCGVEDPVRVTSVAGVRLSQAATVDCSIAKALNSWVDEVAQPAFEGRLVQLQIAAHYACRSRNNIKGAKISEHGKGRAIDISAFVLSNGKVLSVAGDYNKLLRRIYKAGCGYFKTTLGPGSDGYHEDHFHFDTSARKGGAYCR